MTAAQFSAPEYEIVVEDPVMLSDGLATTQSAFVQFDARVPPSLVNLFRQYHQYGLIKIKTARVTKRRDWIRT